MGNPHASTRKYICWDPQNGGQRNEPTSTLVLTASSGHYVDVRVLKSQPWDSEALSSIDWAFAGMSTVLRSPTPGDNSTVMQWAHEIDSRHVGERDPEKLPRDVGRLFPPMENGDTLETGRMESPETGVETEYEELWGSIEVKGVKSGPVEKELEKAAVVLRHSRTEPRVSRGMIVRLGQFVQGMLVEDGELLVERWELDGEVFKRTVKIGKRGLVLPCDVVFDHAGVELGKTIDSHGRAWEVIEKEIWT